MATDPVFALLEDAGGNNGLIVSTYTPPILYGIMALKAYKMSLDSETYSPCDIRGSTVILRSYVNIFFGCKENKNNDFIQHFFSSSSCLRWCTAIVERVF